MPSIVYAGTHRVFVRTGGAWVAQNAAKLPYVMHPGGFTSWDPVFKCYKYLASSSSWVLWYTTSAHAPQLAPATLGLTVTGTITRHVQANWTNPSPPGTYNAYNTFWRFTNNTDATKNTTGNFSPNGGVTTFTVAVAGVSGDSVTVDVWFNDGTFDGPTATASTTL